jgi:hypothetical protein
MINSIVPLFRGTQPKNINTRLCQNIFTQPHSQDTSVFFGRSQDTPRQHVNRELNRIDNEISKKYNIRDRFKASWIDFKSYVKKSTLLKVGFASSPLIPIALMFPPFTVFIMPIPLFLTALASAIALVSAIAAYEDPDSVKGFSPKTK